MGVFKWVLFSLALLHVYTTYYIVACFAIDCELSNFVRIEIREDVVMHGSHEVCVQLLQVKRTFSCCGGLIRTLWTAPGNSLALCHSISTHSFLLSCHTTPTSPHVTQSPHPPSSFYCHTSLTLFPPFSHTTQNVPSCHSQFTPIFFYYLTTLLPTPPPLSHSTPFLPPPKPFFLHVPFFLFSSHITPTSPHVTHTFPPSFLLVTSQTTSPHVTHLFPQAPLYPPTFMTLYLTPLFTYRHRISIYTCMVSHLSIIMITMDLNYMSNSNKKYYKPVCIH